MDGALAAPCYPAEEGHLVCGDSRWEKPEQQGCTGTVQGH